MKVIVNVPGAYKGQEIEVMFLGVFENGFEYDVTGAELETWRTLRVLPRDEDGNEIGRDEVPDVLVVGIHPDSPDAVPPHDPPPPDPEPNPQDEASPPVAEQPPAPPVANTEGD